MDSSRPTNHPPTRLPERITTFCRLIRQGGLEVGTGQIIAALEAVELVGVSRKDDFKAALQACLVTDPGMIPLFERAFEYFWHYSDHLEGLGKELEKLFHPGRLAREGKGKQPEASPAVQQDSSSAGVGGKPDAEGEVAVGRLVYSPEEVLRGKHFDHYTREELDQAVEALRRFRWDFGRRLSRRLTPGPKRQRLYLRGTVRKNIPYSGDFIKLLWQQRKAQPRPVTILCDISGSMENYTRILLHFIHTLARIHPRLEAFTCGTRLSRITPHLRHREADQAVAGIAAAVQDWSGGTRLGRSLEDFNFRWARRVLGSGSVVIIISDGWDTGDIQVLEREMERLQRSCHRLIWLNPNLGYENYQPLTRGIQAVLPHVDDFLPIHNLQSLIDLGSVLGRPAGSKGALAQA